MDWRDLERGVDDIMRRSFGEQVRLSFMANGDVDPARPMLEIRAILAVAGDRTVTLAGMQIPVSAEPAQLFIDRNTYSGPAPKAGDHVRANDRTGQPWFEVRSVSDRYSNLLVLSLNQA